MNIKESEFNKATEKFRGTSLNSDVKQTMLARIYETADITAPAMVSPWSLSFLTLHRYSVACAIVFLLTTATTYASTRSLPGDPLYNFKVNLYEPVALALHFDTASKTEYEITLLQKRVQEIEELKQAGRLNNETYHASYAATEQNVSLLTAEGVSIDTEGVLEISTYIETYNALVDAEFQTSAKDQERREPSETREPRQNSEEDHDVSRTENEKEDTDEEIISEPEETPRTLTPAPRRIPELISPPREIRDSVRDNLDL